MPNLFMTGFVTEMACLYRLERNCRLVPWIHFRKGTLSVGESVGAVLSNAKAISHPGSKFTGPRSWYRESAASAVYPHEHSELLSQLVTLLRSRHYRLLL